MRWLHSKTYLIDPSLHKNRGDCNCNIYRSRGSDRDISTTVRFGRTISVDLSSPGRWMSCS